MKKSVVRIDSTVLLEFTRTSIILCIALLIIGLGLIPVSLIFLIKNNEYLYIMPLVFGFFFACVGAGILIYLLRASMKSKTTDLSVAVEFEEKAFIATTTKNGEVINKEKYLYENILTFRVAKNHIFINVGKNRAIPVEKNDEMVEFLLSKNVKKK